MKSSVWRYFTKTETTKAKCKLCCKTLKTGGGTSNLKQHLIHKHPKIEDEVKKVSDENDVESRAGPSKSPTPSTSLDNRSRSSSPSTSTASSSRARSPSTSRAGRSRSRSPRTSQILTSTSQRRQTTLYETTQRSASYERGGYRDVAISNSLIYMVCKDNAPHSIVEKEGFRRFIKTVAPLYKLPSRNTVTEMISLRYSAIISNMKTKLINVKHLSLTADICTLTNTSRGPEKNEVETIMLGVRRLLEAHTGDYIAQKMEELMESFDISKSKIIAVCTDGGANMIAGVRKLLGEGKHVYCFAHMLNLIVTDGLEDKNNNRLKELIDLVKSFVTFGRHSNNFMDALRAEQQRDGVPEGDVTLFIQSVPTRWNSTFDMLSRFVTLYPYVARVLASPSIKLKNAPRMLSGNEIELLSEIVNILKPFKQATTEISGSDYITGSLVLPMISCIDSALATIKPTNEISTMLLRKLQVSLESRCGHLEKNLLLCNALLCDPRFKKIYMKPVVASQAAMQISEEIKKVQKEMGNYSSPSSASTSRQDDSNESLWSIHDKSLEKPGMSFLEVESSFPSELKLYLHQPVLPRTQNPIQFWHQSKTLMTALSSVAIKYLTVVGSSVASERLVSTLNSVVKDDRMLDYQARWASLRARFSKERSKVLKSGSCSGKPEWPLYKYLQFLDTVVKRRRTFDNVANDEASTYLEDPGTDDELSQVDIPDIFMLNTDTGQNIYNINQQSIICTICCQVYSSW
ncbi:unnamed protein product [Brassicogethes aeneus]|uniref:BED-type domain-containing protein n=1 Tax=Brassicogethes aeneus TaxID=1431903 RepID=A0A9P0FM09_BRAAE|nr:unnamed protein product [Brassicogethes aeneus]